ncbi:MAG: replicative DNA helicase, partial [Cyanobacteria bacterium J06638_22]
QLVDQVVSAVNIDAHCELIKDKWRRREWIAIARRMTLQGYDLATPWTQVVSEGEAQLYQFLTTEQSQKGIQHISEYCHREMDRIAEAEAGGQIVKALSTGFWDLDALTHGAPEEELIIIAGRPAMGKTSFVLRLARNVAAHRPVAVFSLEMSGDRLARRLWSAESRITPGHLAQSPNLREPAIAGIGQVAGMNIWIGEFNTEIEAICTNARRLAAEQGQLGAIAIDYLGLIDLPAAGNEASALGKITRRMKLLAVELKTTIFLLHQLSRAPESRTNKRPQLSDLRDSGKIEQDADQVLFMYRDEYYHPDTPDRGIAEIIVAKNRNGPIGTVKLLFEPQFTDFKNVARWSG